MADQARNHKESGYHSLVALVLAMQADAFVAYMQADISDSRRELARQHRARAAESAAKATQDSTGFGRIAQFASIFSGGSLSQSTIFGLGIMPYITASIIFQLLNSVLPGLQELKKEGASGQQKITEWTRYATVAMRIDIVGR